MAVTITVTALAAAMRLGDSTEETAEATRLLALGTEAVTKYAPEAPEATMNEAVIRLCAYLYDQPHAARGDGFANALRSSGAAGLLLPYREHRAGLVQAQPGGTTAAPQPDPGPGPAGPAVDQTARDDAARAQAAADAAQRDATAAGQAATSAGRTATAAGQAALAAQQSADTNTGFLSTFGDRVKAVVERIVPAWARRATEPAPGRFLTIPEADITISATNQISFTGVTALPALGRGFAFFVPSTFAAGHAPVISIGGNHYLIHRGDGSSFTDPVTELPDGSYVELVWAGTTRNFEALTHLPATKAAAEKELPALPEDGHPYTLQGRDPIGEGPPIRYWSRPNFVPNTPGDSSGIGHVLTVTGENDRDFNWRSITATITRAVAAYLTSNPPEDTDARRGVMTNAEKITANTNALDSKQNKLTQAQLVDLLQFDVVPGVIVGYTTDGQPADWLTDWRVWVSGGHTVGDVWFTMTAEGLPLLAAPAPTAPGANLHRHKLTATNIYNFTLSNSSRANLISGRKSRRQGRDIEIDLIFYDAAADGNVIDTKTIAVDWLAAPSGGGGAAPRWYEMARLLDTDGFTSGTKQAMVLQAEGKAKYADAAAVRAAVKSGAISMLALQRSDSDEQTFAANANNFLSSERRNFRVEFVFEDGTDAYVEFEANQIALTANFAETGVLRFDLGVFSS